LSVETSEGIIFIPHLFSVYTANAIAFSKLNNHSSNTFLLLLWWA